MVVADCMQTLVPEYIAQTGDPRGMLLPATNLFLITSIESISCRLLEFGVSQSAGAFLGYWSSWQYYCIRSRRLE